MFSGARSSRSASPHSSEAKPHQHLREAKVFMEDNDQDFEREPTKSGSQMLLIFLGLVVFGALLFGFGYAVGHSAVKMQGSLNGAANPPLQGATNLAKPGADQPGPTLPPCQPAAPAVDQSQPQPAPAAEAQPEPAPVEAKAAKPDKADKSKDKAKTPAAKTAAAPTHATAPAGSGIMVQVAAVSRREDAERLRNSLEQKRYPVYVSSSPSDSLFHVQVGPYATKDDAEKIKKQLTDLGYTPIVKH